MITLRLWYGINMRYYNIMGYPSYSTYILTTFVRKFHNNYQLMAGHNRWSKIKRPKAAADLEWSKKVGKICSEIRTAVRLGGGNDPDSNLRLAGVIARARSMDVPKSTIENALVSSSSTEATESSRSLIFEARSSSGFSLIIETTDGNKNRIKNDLHKILKKYKVVMVDSKTVLFQFDHKGIVCISKSSLYEAVGELDNEADDPLLEFAIEIGAEDFKDYSSETNQDNDEEYDYIEFICDPKELKEVTDAVADKGIEIIKSSLTYIPNTWVTIKKSASERAVELITELKENPDVIKVHTNYQT